MIDKELEAIYKCHEYLQDLNNDARMRVFKYLLDRYGLVNFETNQQPNFETKSISPEPEPVISEVIKVENKVANTSKASNPIKKVKPTSNQSYSLVTSLNLVSKAKMPLKEYFSQFETKSNFDNNIVILTYLKNELKEENVSVNHIYTCYKHLNIKIPSIKQSLFDTKNRKGWIETSNIDDLSITVSGENYIDHEIIRK